METNQSPTHALQGEPNKRAGHGEGQGGEVGGGSKTELTIADPLEPSRSNWKNAVAGNVFKRRRSSPSFKLCGR